MEALLSEFKEDLEEFREMTDKFYAKEGNVKTYKGFSGGAFPADGFRRKS